MPGPPEEVLSDATNYLLYSLQAWRKRAQETPHDFASQQFSKLQTAFEQLSLDLNVVGTRTQAGPLCGSATLASVGKRSF
jgi:hypothetical protein